MSELDNELQRMSNFRNEWQDKLLKYAKDIFPFAVLLMSIAVTVVTRLYRFGLNNPFTPEFFIQLGTNILTTMVPYAVFVSHGYQTFKDTNEAYRQNLCTWGEYSAKIRKTMSKEFIAYCREYVDILVERNRRMKFECTCMIPWDTYLADFAQKKPKDIKALYDKGDITKSEMRAILTASRPIKKRPKIDAVSILCGSDSVNIEKIPKGNRNRTLGQVIMRPFCMLALSAGMALVSSEYLGVESADVIFNLFTSAFMILIAGITGNSAGNSSARKEAGDVKSRIFFIDQFFSKNPIDKPQKAE